MSPEEPVVIDNLPNSPEFIDYLRNSITEARDQLMPLLNRLGRDIDTAIAQLNRQNPTLSAEDRAAIEYIYHNLSHTLEYIRTIRADLFRVMNAERLATIARDHPE